MRSGRTATGLLIIALLAGLGLVLVLVPGQLVEVYRKTRDLHPWVAIGYLVVVGIGAALFLVANIWIVVGVWRRTRRKRERRRRAERNPSQLSAVEQQQELQENLERVDDYREEEGTPPELREHLERLSQRLEEKREGQRLEIVAFGTISSGKSSLLNALAGREVFLTDARGGTTMTRNEVPWSGGDRVTLVDTPGLGEIDGEERVRLAAESAQDADLVLLVVDGPLRETEHALLEQLGKMEKRIVVCLNKVDWYADADRDKLLGQLRGQTRDVVRDADVVAVRAQPVARRRVRVLADGSELEEECEVPADIAHLARRMLDIVSRDGRELLLANLLLQSRALVDEARLRVRETLDRRAWEIVERYTWGAGGAAALSPLPVVDLIAGGAISAKMVVDLGRVYRQEMDADTAVRLLGQLGKNLLATLGVSAATPAVVAGVGSLLKVVPGVGTIAGGVLQGVVQALVTRWIGAVFIGYYQDEHVRESSAALSSLARREWQRLTSLQELRRFLKTAREQFSLSRAADDHVLLSDAEDGDDEHSDSRQGRRS